MRLLIIWSIVGLLSVLGVGAAFAGKPANQACLGHDFSGYAKNLPWSDIVKSLTDGGVGGEVQAHLAGQVPDSIIPNSCNDPD